MGSPAAQPGMPDRPHSVENPATPRTPRTPGSMDELVQIDEQHMQQISTSTNSNSGGGGGGGNPHMHPIPAPSCFGRFGYIKLGLRGGSPMWGGYAAGSSRLTKPNQSNTQQQHQQQQQQGQDVQEKVKKESHLSKVSILKRNPLKKPMQIKQVPHSGAGASNTPVSAKFLILFFVG